MAITNTGIVERVITGVNESDLFLDSEATSTVNNTGIVERPITGSNESELWLDAESTSVVNNTGIVERPITGVNESDPMFPNNTISNIVNLAGNLLIALINAFKSRVSSDGGTLDNEVGLNIDDLDDTASLTMIPNAYKDGTLYSVLPEDGSGDFDVVRGSGGTRVNSLGLIEEVSSNEPRIDYTSGSPVLLVEPQATNLFRDSTIVDSNGGGVVTVNAAISPDGTQNASLVDFFTGSNDGGRLKIGGSTATPSTDYVISFYAKSVVGDGTFDLRIDTDTQVLLVGINLAVTSEWVRYTHTFTTDAASSSFGSGSRIRRGFTNNNEILFYGMQLEVGPPATSYIPTTGTIATRLADSVTGAGDANTFNSTEGVLYVECARDSNDGNTGGIQINSGSFDNSLRLFFNQSDTISVITRVGGTNNIVKTAQAITSSTAMNKFALVWKLNDYKMYYNGSVLWSDTTAPVYPVGTLNNLDLTSQTTPFNGTIKDLRVYPTALTDAELLTLTTL